jgi:hypothetical protein
VYIEMPYHKALASHFRFLKIMGQEVEIKPRGFA